MSRSNKTNESRLEIIGEGPRVGKQQRRSAICRCVCGNTKVIERQHIISGVTKSCGCLVGKFHGHTAGRKESREYRIWKGMKTRCLNPNHRVYHNYEGRGITICEEWSGSFETFYKDMGRCPSRHTLERIKNHLGYFKENCKWATRKEQSRNQRTNRKLTAFDKTALITEWAVLLKCHYMTIHYHLAKGRSMEWVVTHFQNKIK